MVTGYPEYAPGLDGLPVFEVYTNDGKTFVKVPEKIPFSTTMPMTKHDPSKDNRNFVIIGGGAAGLQAAEGLRQNNYEGKITMISNENLVPYDRTLLSKNLGKDASNFKLRGEEFFNEHDIVTKLGHNVQKINADQKEVTLANGITVKYDKLLIASGCFPKVPFVPGTDLSGVHTYRNANDHEQIRGINEDVKKVVIIGSSFIGCEAAAALRTKHPDLEITVVSGTGPYER